MLRLLDFLIWGFGKNDLCAKAAPPRHAPSLKGPVFVTETNTSLTKKMKGLQEENETKNARLGRLEATVDKLMQQSC